MVEWPHLLGAVVVSHSVVAQLPARVVQSFAFRLSAQMRGNTFRVFFLFRKVFKNLLVNRTHLMHCSVRDRLWLRFTITSRPACTAPVFLADD